MNFKVFSENTWLYPDSDLSFGKDTAELYSAKNADVCFQILTDFTLDGGEKLSANLSIDGVSVALYQLCAAHVPHNSGILGGVAENYEDVKHLVNRKAPFDIYDITRPAEFGAVTGRAAFYVRITVAKNAPVGHQNGILNITFGQNSIAVPLNLEIFDVTVPDVKDAAFHIVNWIYYEQLADRHHVKVYSEEYYEYLEGYLKNQIDLRSDYLMLPAVKPIKDESGKIIDFDFTAAERVGNMALKAGHNVIMGAHVATWLDWREPDLKLVWDTETSVKSIEAYRQLKIYFAKVCEISTRNGWGERYFQCLTDEPQTVSADTYRILSSICRKELPGIKILDAIEAVELSGALDFWVVKNHTFEKNIEKYKLLQEIGEEMWLYACGWPGGRMLNRVCDISLNASRLTMWGCYKYGCKGFLHFGYNLISPYLEKNLNHISIRGKDKYFPAGNAVMVYPFGGKKAPFCGVRAHSQRGGAQDFELFYQLGQKDKEKAMSIVNKVCRSLTDYDDDATALDNARIELLKSF